MKMPNIHQFLLMIVLLLQLSAEPNSIDDAPKLISDNGNIIFQTALAKSISFMTQNGGQIRLNDIDLNALSNEIRSIRNSMEQIKDLKKCNCELINNKLDIYSRKFESLENSLATTNSQITNLVNENQVMKEKLIFDDCANNPCHNGAQCIDSYNTFKCICTPNFKGKHCTEDVNECLQIAGTIHGCQNNARCENTIGSFRCVCAGKWSGVLCNIPINSCSNASNTEICGHGTCYPDHSPNNPKPFKCVCDSGWSLDSITQTCIADIDECRVGKYPCSIYPLVSCINTPGDVRCEDCPSGFEGNGFSCMDVNECANANTCGLNEECINNFGSYKCICVQGMRRGVNGFCQPENVCETNNGGCNSNAMCIMNNFRIEGRICTCNLGYIGNGEGPNGCTLETPSNVTNRSYRRCIRRQLCRNGGTCQSTTSGFRCQCLPGFTGGRCRTVINNQCTQNPCLNQGQCEFLSPNHYRCHCKPLFSGVNCENEHTDCGGTYITSSEEKEISLFISSSSQSSTRSFRFPCTWTIIASNEQFLQIIPITLQLRGICWEEYVQLKERSPLDEVTNDVGRYCQQSNSILQQYNTTGSILIIIAQLKTTITQNHGFKLKIIPRNIPIDNLDCCKCTNHLFTKTRLSNGLFQSPHFPLNYPLNVDCSMEFEREFGEKYRIEIQIKTLDLGDKISNCSDSDYLKIHFVESGELKITACNQNLFYNKKFITSGFIIHFHSDSRNDINSTRFQLRWKKSIIQDPCGGTVSINPSGSLQSPAISADDEAFCTWKIPQANSSRLIFFKGFFENWVNGDCSVQLAIMKISNFGRNETIWYTCQTQTMLSELKEQFDGDIIIIFKKSKGVSTPFFQITLEYVCGQSINMDEIPNYEFQSENYPDNYDDNLHCVYKFSAKTRKIAITFSDVDINDNFPCNFDYIEIIGSNSRYLDKKYCNGNKEELIPINMHHQSQSIIIIFKTNSSISGQGFKAKVTVFECGGSFFLKNKLIIGYPEGHLNESTYDLNHQYETNKNCTWEITALPGNIIFFLFDHFHLEYHANCQYDYLELNYGNTTSRFCGTDAQTGHTNSHKLKIKFISDYSIPGEGFVMRFYTALTNRYCHQSIEASEGVISSPPIQSLARPYLCYYFIKVPNPKKIILNVTVSRVDESNDSPNFGIPCFGNSKLKIINGAIGSTEIAQICPKHPQQGVIKTTSYTATILYMVPQYRSASEFNFTISFFSLDEECGSIHTDNSGEISSPNYPLFAPQNTYCRWEIQTRPGKLLVIKILHIRSGFNDETKQCNDKNPVIKLKTTKKDINIICSEQLLQFYVFDEQLIKIIFQNFANSKYRFRLEYKQNCRYTIDALNGRIESNNIISYPFYCLWTLATLRGSKITIQIDKFDLPPSLNGICTSYVEISDRNGYVMRKACGNELLNRTFTSSNPPLKIKHYVDRRTPIEVIHFRQGLVLEYQTQGCAETINYDPNEEDTEMKKTGSIQSAQYPNLVSNIDCVWNFQTIPGYSIKFKFDVIEMESFINCTEGPILKAWENEIAEENYVFQACHRIDDGKAIEFQSSINNVYLKFFSAKDLNGGQRKFHGTYEFVNTSCQYELSGSEGIIQSPNYPNPYPHNLRCSWNVKVRESMSIHLKFLDFEIEDNNCRYDFVELFSPINNDMVKLKRLCGIIANMSTTIYDSLSNQMLIKFRSDHIIRSRGFKAKYFEGCGGLRMATESNQFLLSPNYPHAYTLPDGICEWNLVANTSEIGLRIFFYFMGFEGGSNNPNCSTDNSLTIIEGLENNSTVKAVLCTKSAYHPIISSGHYLKIILRSTTGHAIFKAAYGTGSSICGGDYYLDDGLITNPFYPNAVNMELDCLYIIRNSPGSTIDLSIEEFTRQNAHAYVLHDFIDIRNGPNENSSSIGRFYLLSDLRNLTNDFKFNNSVWIRLRSQGGDYTNNIKFLARYHINYITEFRSDNGVLASPQFGHVYNQDTEISWTINAETSDTLQITFDQFSVGRKLTSGECSRGKLTIADSNNNVQVFCGSNAFQSATFSTPITVTLSAEGYRYPGFLLRWSIPSNESHTKLGNCEYIIRATENEQILSSPHYPNFDLANRFCKWTIVTDKKNALDLKVLNFTLEDSRNCKYENFTVEFNGRKYPQYRFGIYFKKVFCGSPNLSIFNFFKYYYINEVQITYMADEFDYFPGFKLSYKLGCFQDLTDSTEGWLQNDEYPNRMSNNKNCTYILQVRGNRNFQLNFTALNLPPQINGKCENGYIKISTRRMNQTYCGSSIPTNLSPLMTNSSLVVIQLVGNFSRYFPYSGFRLMYSIEDTEECGGSHKLIRTGDNRIITSPGNNTHIAPHFIECKWYFTSPYGTRMQIDFENLFISGACNESFLAFYEGSTALAQKIGGINYCKKRDSIFTTGNLLMVMFKNWNDYSKFRLNIKLSLCGGLLHRSKGIISSPNYPLNYPQKSNCIWQIIGRRASNIKLRFIEKYFDRNCSRSNFTVVSIEDSGNVVSWNNCNSSLSIIHITNNNIQIIFATNTRITQRGFKLEYTVQSFKCGGQYTDPAREFNSTNYPKLLPSYAICFWKITVDISSRIVINIKKLTMTSGCLLITNSAARYRVKICNQNLNNYEIDTKLFSVKLILQNIGGGSLSFGYNSNLPSICGAHIYPNINGTGIITIENVDISYCKHIIHNYPENEGTVAFKSASLYGINCTQNNLYLKSLVLSGQNRGILDIGSACQTVMDRNAFVTLGKQIEFIFNPSRSVNVSNYKVKLPYKYQRCGGMLMEPYGYIKSPGYPETYPSNANCEWVINAPENMYIQLIIRILHLEHNQLCSFDHLFIRYGGEFDSPPFKKFCGRNPIDNETMIFHNNQLRLSFHSDISVSKDGFYIEYSFVNAVDNCNGIIFSVAGSIKTPNYPRPYPSNLKCNWTIVLPRGYQVSLTFQTPFDLETSTQNTCPYDSLKIFDSNATNMLVELCGHVPPSNPIISSVNQMSLVFTSDYNLNLDGFHAKYKAVCGGRFNESFGEIYSPTTSATNAIRLNCEYIVPGWQDHLMVVQIVSNFRGCLIQIFLEDKLGGYILSRYICGRNNKVTILHSRSIKIVYKTLKYFLETYTFSARYLHDENVRIFNNMTRPFDIKTPHFPTPYHHNANLLWKFTAPVGYIFYIKSLSVDIEPSNDGCLYDYVSFSSNNSLTPSNIFCGNLTNIFPFMINSNVLNVNFRSDSSHHESHTGFMGRIKPTPGPSMGCGGFVNVTPGISGVISSLDIDNNGYYENNLHCEWQLTTPFGRALQLTFENGSVSMEKRIRGQCRYDSLTIYDGPDSARPIIQIICDDDQVDPITSHGNNMLILFETDGSINNRGFKLTYTSVVSQNHVIRTATNSDQFLESPDYPNDTPYDFRFMGEIASSTESNHIIVTINDLKLRSSVNCSLDKFIIQDISLKYMNKIQMFCKPLASPYVFISSHDKLVVQYRIGPVESLNDLSNKRFKINYKLYNCNRTEQAYSGNIINIETLKQNRYAHNLYCNLTLIAPTENLRFQFYFKHFSLEGSATCNYDYIQFIYGGPNEPQYTLPKICGTSLPPSIVSNSSRVTMIFSTDHSINQDGFHITYVVNRDPLNKCGGEINLDSGAITSPGFGLNYYENGQCTWNINLVSDNSLKWRFTALQLGNSTNFGPTCYSDTDFVKISYGNQVSKYCGYMMPNEEFIVRSTSLTVEYKSLSGGTGTGFRITWEAV